MKFTIPIVVATPFVVYLAVRLGVDVVNNLLHHATTSLTKSQAEPPATTSVIDHSEANPLGLILAFAATVGLAADFWGRRKTTEAWRIGAEGEERLRARLDRLVEHGFHVFHDPAVLGSRANIDHLVIGPPGMYVVDAKHYSTPVRWGTGTLWSGRDPLTKKLDTVPWEAEKVEQRLLNGGSQVSVRPVMCVLGTTLPKPSMLLEGVRVVEGPRALVKGLRAAPRAMTDDMVRNLVEVVVERSFAAR